MPYTAAHIPGYEKGSPDIPHSPVTLRELELLKQTVGFTPEDEYYLRMSREVLADQLDQVLDVWFEFIAQHPQLAASFGDLRDGELLPDYVSAVRQRFGEWILDTASADYDQAWLDWQEEVGRRHHRIGKNRTDQAHSTPVVPFRYMVPLIGPLTSTLRAFLGAKGHSPLDVEWMHQAWVKSVLLQVGLWSRPYVDPVDW